VHSGTDTLTSQSNPRADDLASDCRRAKDKAALLGLLVQGCAGALIATLIAAALARGLFPADGLPTSTPGGLLPWTLGGIRLEPREKGFYLLSLLLGPAGAFLASCRPLRDNILYFAVLLVAAIAPANAYLKAALQGGLPAWAGLVGSLALAVIYLALLSKRGTSSSEKFVAVPTEPAAHPAVSILIFGLIALLVVPTSFQAVAARVGMEMHVVSFLIGPSLYFLGHGLLPGVDYYAQYGVGLGWIFSFLVGKTAEDTMVNYVVLMVVALWLFFSHLAWLLNWLYRSWLTAAAVVLLVLVLLFHNERHFFDPSSFVLRYPLLTVCAALLARWVATPRDWTRLLPLALALSLGVFIETETGVVIAISTVVSFLLVAPLGVSSLVLIAAVGASGLVFLAALTLFVFGPQALTVQFVMGLIEPLTIYGVAGFGGWPIAWTLREWNWLYNLVAPGIAIATIGIMPRIVDTGLVDKPRATLVTFFSVCGVLMAAKFINMSIVAVWQVNALSFLVVLGWWAVVAARAAPRRLEVSRQLIPARGMAITIMLVLAVALAVTSRDQRNPSVYGLRSWARYPSIIMRPFQRLDGCTEMSCVANRPNERDVALIRDRTQPGQPVAIVGDLFDWTYLINAHRPPLMTFLPSVVIFTKHQLDESWKRMATAEYWFVPKGADGKPRIDNVDLAPLVLPALEQDFVLDGVGDRLMAWKRKGR
jgi:hypothetical protein